MKWFIKCLKHYFDFEGRARRREYWLFCLFNVLFSFIFSFADQCTGIAITTLDNPYESIPVLGELMDPSIYLFRTVYSLFILLPGLSVAVRRLHDTGRSGWNLLWALIPLFGAIWVLILLLLDSYDGENDYGPNPKASGCAETKGDGAEAKTKAETEYNKSEYLK